MNIYNRYIIPLIITVMLFTGCKAVLTKKYKLNQPFSFNSRTAYLGYLYKKYSFLPEQILYPDSLQQSFFLGLANSKLSQYYGTFLNDSTEVEKSSLLSENLSCIGRVLKEIEKNTQKIESAELVTNTSFRDRTFRIASNDSRFSLTSDGKLKVILIYAYALGTYFDGFFKELSEWSRDHRDKVDIYVISLDPVQSLPL